MIEKSEFAELIQNYANTKSDALRSELVKTLDNVYRCPNSEVIGESACRNRFACIKSCGDMSDLNVTTINAAIDEYNRRVKLFDDAMSFPKITVD